MFVYSTKIHSTVRTGSLVLLQFAVWQGEETWRCDEDGAPAAPWVTSSARSRSRAGWAKGRDDRSSRCLLLITAL